MDFDREYLQALEKIETPKLEPNMANDEREEQCADYSYLRNLAEELLSDINNKWVNQRLSDLVIKLGLEEI